METEGDRLTVLIDHTDEEETTASGPGAKPRRQMALPASGPVYALIAMNRNSRCGPWGVVLTNRDLRTIADRQAFLRTYDPALNTMIGAFSTAEAAHRDVAMLNEPWQ